MQIQLPQIIILNGSSSSGKTTLARALQSMLPETYLYFGIDAVLATLPASEWQALQSGQAITRPGYSWQALVRGYHYALPALLQAGNALIIDNAWCEIDEKRELLTELAGYAALLVGVQCDQAETLRRDAERGDRAPGQAEWEISRVHQHMQYDLVVDTTGIGPETAASKVFDYILSCKQRSGAAETLESLNLL